MKKLKYIFWLILAALLTIVVAQNFEFFARTETLKINLWFYKIDDAPPLATGAIIAIFVGISVLLMMMLYLASRFDGYRAKKVIKELKTKQEEDADTIAKLTEEVEMLKGGSEELAAPDSDDNVTDAQDGKASAIEAETTPTTQA